MKQPTFTDEKIVEAGMQLLADKKRVTPFGIRKIIGGGNPERIKKVWSANQTNTLEGTVVKEQIELPTEFENSLEMTKVSLDELAKRLYGRAQEIAESRVRESISAAGKAKETAEAEIIEAMDAVSELDQDNNTLQNERDELRDHLQQQIADNARLQERIGILTQKSDKNLQELKEEKANSIRLEKEVTTLQVKYNLIEQQNKTLLKQEAGLQNQLLIANKKIQSSEVSSVQLTTELAALKSQIEQRHQQVESLQEKLTNSRQQEGKAKEAAAELRGKVAVFETQKNRNK